MIEELVSNINYNVALQRSQVLQMQFDTTDEFLYYTPSSRSEYSVTKFSTPKYEYSDWRANSSGTDDGFSDDASESTDMESHNIEPKYITPALLPPPSIPRKPSTKFIPRSTVLSDRRAKCRMSFGIATDDDEEDKDMEDDGCSVVSDEAIWDGDRQMVQSIIQEQQEEIVYCRERIARMTKNIQEQSKRAHNMMQTVHHRDEEIDKMQMAMNRFRHLLKLKDNEIQDLLKVIQESC